MIIIIMIACCYVGALGPKAELILACADIAELDGFLKSTHTLRAQKCVPKVYPAALAGARGGAGGFSCPHTSAHDQGRHPPSAVCQSDV